MEQSLRHQSLPAPSDDGRKLRRLIVLANIAAWIAIAVAIRLIFF